MSVTCILVPVLEPEAEALIQGGAEADEARQAIVARGGPLRARVARVDAVREDLHELLFPRWEGATYRAPTKIEILWRYFQTRKPARPLSGYDPFVHLWGRSLPVGGRTSLETARRLATLLEQDEDAFEAGLAEELKGLDPRAAERFLAEPRQAAPEELESAVAGQAALAARAFEDPPPTLRRAVDAVARVSAWSWPVWRLDGEMLGPLLQTLGATVQPGRASPLFEPFLDDHPRLPDQLFHLPKKLGDFTGAGAFLSSLDVKTLARSLQLYRSRVSMNVAESGENELIVMRHARLLEEALLFCEAQGLALVEAAGVEWHDRSHA